MSETNPIQELWRQFKAGSSAQQALTFLRVATGVYFLLQGYHKFNDPRFGTTLEKLLREWVVQNPFPFYRQFLEQFAIPNAAHLAQWVTDGELAVGFSYVLGLFVSLSAPLAIFLNLNFLLASQHAVPGMLGHNLMFILISIALSWGRAGEYFGLDALRKGRPASQQSSGKTNKKLETVTAELKKAKEEGSPKNGGKKNAKARINPF